MKKLLPFLSRDGTRSKGNYRRLGMSRTPSASSGLSSRRGLGGNLRYLWRTLVVAVAHLNYSTDPNETIKKLEAHQWSYRDMFYVFHAFIWIFSCAVMNTPVLIKIGIPILYITAITIPFTSQLLWPALPILSWVILFFSSRFIPVEFRPRISVSLLPTLESVLFGANISDILTRFTHPLLDIPAWLSYGVVHFVGPFVVAFFMWLFAARGALRFWCLAIGTLNLTGVIVQILMPCAPPWYELRNGLTPADYSMPGSPGGLVRIDHLFHSNGYTVTFSTAPVVFGAFPSLHGGDATLSALFISHFFPHLRYYAWGYVLILYWATMYLTHHYLIDVTCGACLATAYFYLLIPRDLRAYPPDNTTNTNWSIVNGVPGGIGNGGSIPNGGFVGVGRDRYEAYDLETPTTAGESGRLFRAASEDSLSDEDAPPNPLTPYGHIRRGSTPIPSPRLAPASTAHGSSLSAGSVGGGAAGQGKNKSHRHTASIASLIRAEERLEDGWSPVRKDFAFPPQSPNPLVPTPQASAGPSTPSFAGSALGAGGASGLGHGLGGGRSLTPVQNSRGGGGSSVGESGSEEGVRSRSPSWPSSSEGKVQD